MWRCEPTEPATTRRVLSDPSAEEFAWSPDSARVPHHQTPARLVVVAARAPTFGGDIVNDGARFLA
jgi:hypothetical protein